MQKYKTIRFPPKPLIYFENKQKKPLYFINIATKDDKAN